MTAKACRASPTEGTVAVVLNTPEPQWKSAMLAVYVALHTSEAPRARVKLLVEDD